MFVSDFIEHRNTEDFVNRVDQAHRLPVYRTTRSTPHALSQIQHGKWDWTRRLRSTSHLASSDFQQCVKTDRLIWTTFCNTWLIWSLLIASKGIVSVTVIHRSYFNASQVTANGRRGNYVVDAVFSHTGIDRIILIYLFLFTLLQSICWSTYWNRHIWHTSLYIVGRASDWWLSIIKLGVSEATSLPRSVLLHSLPLSLSWW